MEHTPKNASSSHHTFPVRANLGGFATRGDAIALGINKLVHVSTLSSLTEKPVALLGHTSSALQSWPVAFCCTVSEGHGIENLGDLVRP